MRAKLLTAGLTLFTLVTTGCTDLLADPPPTTADTTFERKRKTDTSEPEKKPDESKPQTKPAATADDIRNIFREEVPKTLEPIVKQVNALNAKVAKLDETVELLQANSERLESDTARALASFRTELADLRRGFVQLGTVVGEVKAKMDTADKNPPTADLASLQKTLAKLGTKVDALTERVSGYTPPRQPDKPSTPPPTSAPPSNPTTKKTVVLPCGFRIDQLDVPDGGGVYVRCPKCGGLTFVR